MLGLPETFSKIAPRLVKTFTAVAVLTIGLFGSFVWHTWDTFRYLETTQKNYFRLSELSGSIVHIDEVLTMSARMAAATGDHAWEARYRGFETKLEAAIREAMVLGQSFSLKDAAAKTEAANLKLVGMENRAFDLVHKGQAGKASAILAGVEYDVQKKIYLSGIVQITGTIRANLEKDIAKYHRRAYLAMGAILIATPCLLFGWILVARLIRQYNVNRKRTEEALRKSEEKFRTIFDRASDGILIADAATKKFLQGNATICSMLGYTKEEIESLTVYDIHPPNDISIVLDEFERLANGEKILAENLPVLRKDGAIFYADIASSPAAIAGIPCLVGIFRDITEHKKIEEEIARAAREWQVTFDATNDAIWILDKDQRVLRSNGTAERFFHRPYGKFIGKYCWEIVHSTTQPISECPFSRAQESLHRATGELQEGERWFEVIVDPILDAAGRFAGAVHIVSDITERKSADNALRRAEENFRRSLDDSPLGVRIVSEEGETIYANRAVLDIYGYDSVDELKATPARKRYTSVSYGEFQIRRDKRKRGDSLPAEYEINIVKKDGEVRHLQVFRKETLWDGERQFQVIYQDITERKRAEKEQTKLQAQLTQAQKVESIGRLAGGVAHDFNNMLGVILGHVELAIGNANNDPSLLANLQEIRNAAERSAGLTNQLLAFARRQTVSPKVLNLNDTIEGMLKMLRRFIGEGIHLAWLPGVNLWPLKMDPSQIDQMLANLCVNARDAIGGVGKITVETGNRSFDDEYCATHTGFVPGEYVLLAVSDDGCGMDGETLGNLFEPFFTTKAMGEGTGLGLAMLYGIVKQNNGFINVYSEPALGTTFKIYLPRHQGQAEESRQEERRKPVMGGQETVLLVEDEPALLDLSKLLLETQGYRVLTADTPGKAIRLAEEHPGEIHLLLTDVVMPEMNGRNLAEHLLARYPNLKCLFTSGYTANVIAHHGVLEEKMNFIQKPFSRKDLASKVREVLDQK